LLIHTFERRQLCPERILDMPRIGVIQAVLDPKGPVRPRAGIVR
jgi:hypothetical protein